MGVHIAQNWDRFLLGEVGIPKEYRSKNVEELLLRVEPARLWDVLVELEGTVVLGLLGGSDQSLVSFLDLELWAGLPPARQPWHERCNSRHQLCRGGA